mgnify:CR=1 FL=1
MAELAYAQDLGSCPERGPGSNPGSRTTGPRGPLADETAGVRYRIRMAELEPALREGQKLTLEACAQRLGLSASYLSQVETNQRPVTARVLIASNASRIETEFPRPPPRL